MEIADIILEAAGNPVVFGVALGPVVMALVGLIRHQTKADGPIVRWIALGVALAAVTLFNVVEGGMMLTEGMIAAAVGAVVAIGGHETGGKWLREMFGAWAKKSQRESSQSTSGQNPPDGIEIPNPGNGGTQPAGS